MQNIKLTTALSNFKKATFFVDEIFSNIASYCTLECVVDFKNILLRFEDDQIPYDPTQKEDPNTTPGAIKRRIGSLGIFMG